MDKIRDLRLAITFRNHTAIIGANGFNEESNQYKKEKEFYMKSRLFTLKDYKWTDTYNASTNFNNDDYPVSKLILTEFQPEKTVPWGKLVDNLGKVTGGLTNILGIGGGTIAGSIAKMTQDQLIDQLTSQGHEEDLITANGASMKFIQNLVKGQYLNAYEIPFFDNLYFKVDTTGNWSSAGAEAMMGQEMARVAQETSNINFPMTPTWSKTGEDGFDLQSEFHLINDTTENLKQNFSFLHAFAAGAFWVQANMVQFPPNLYDVYCPGRFHKYWCAMGLTVTNEGKMRQNIDLSSNLRSKANFKGLQFNNLYPEAYKVNVSLKDLTPNNYNVWAENFIKGPFNEGGTIGLAEQKAAGLGSGYLIGRRSGNNEVVQKGK